MVSLKETFTSSYSFYLLCCSLSLPLEELNKGRQTAANWVAC